MDFGDAIRALKNGERVARSGWNGKDMWLWLEPAKTLTGGAPVETYEKFKGRWLPWIGMRTAQGEFVPWLASQTDMLATDWAVVEP